METSLLVLSMFSIISVILFVIRYKQSRNVLLFGKVVSRLLIVLGAITAVVSQDFISIGHILATFSAVIISDILYDFSVLYVKKIEDDIHKHFHEKYNTLLDNLETPALIIEVETGKILYRNKAFLNLFNFDDSKNIFEIDKKFPFCEGKHTAYIGGKEHTVINFISKNSINTMTVLIY